MVIGLKFELLKQTKVTLFFLKQSISKQKKNSYKAQSLIRVPFF